ncbi:MAG TPA: hypothetical protein VK957_01720 [Lunatimonas sp.]|nr:hypothetical protein [Lunatimonas sp.]
MKIHYWAGLFIVWMGIEACTTKEDEVAKLKTEVIAVHDEVMPKMGELRSNQKLLEAREEELRETSADSSEIQMYRQAALACDEAYEGMFVWMRQFDSKLDGMNEEESLSYLQDQWVKVNRVNRDIKQALEEAEKLLER